MKGAFAVFCDEIRREDSGKLIYLGVYVDEMVFERLPARLRALSIIVNYWEDKDDVYSGEVAVVVSLPGGANTRFPLEKLTDAEALEAARRDPDVTNYGHEVYLTLPDLELQAEGRLKVDVEIGGQILRAGSLLVRTASP